MEPKRETTERKRAVQAIPERRIWLPIAGMFVLLCILVWLDEILDLPHLLLGAPHTPINLREAIIEIAMVASVGLFAVLRLIRDITERVRAEEELRKYRDHLEELVEERTAELMKANEQLQQGITERKRAEEGQHKALAAKEEALAEALRATHALRASEEALTKLLELSRALATTRDMDAALTQTVHSAVEIVPAADTCTLQWLDDDGETLHTVASSNINGVPSGIFPFRVGVGVAGHALAGRQLINVPDVLVDQRFVSLNAPPRFRSLLVAPLVVKDQALGTLSLTGKRANAFASTDEILIGLVADQIAAALENARDFTARRSAEEALQEAHEQLDATMNALPDTLFEVDRQGRIYDFRSPRPELLYVPPEEFLGQTVKDVLPEDAASIILEAIAQAVEKGKHAGAIYSLPTPAGIRWSELSLATKGDPNRPDVHLTVLVRDITERKQMEDRLRQQRDLLESTIEALDEPFCVINVNDYTIEMANSAARNLGPETTTCYVLFHQRDRPCDGAAFPCPLEQVKKTKEPVATEHIHRNAAGDARYVEVRGYPVLDDDGDVIRMIEYTLDITKRVQTEGALREAAATAERQRLARELHDAVTQTLFSASLIAEALPRVWERHPEEGQGALEELRRLTRGASAEMRALLLELRPAALTEKPLGGLLGHLAEAVTSRTRVPVTTTVEGDCPLPDDVQIALYRIAQEALNNVAKHAEASTVSVTVSCQPERAALCIHDDGRGFDPSDVLPDQLGLGIMRERAEAIGAALTIESQIGHGTRVGVVWQVGG